MKCIPAQFYPPKKNSEEYLDISLLSNGGTVIDID